MMDAIKLAVIPVSGDRAGFVENIIEAPPGFALDGFELVPVTGDCAIGHQRVGNAFVAPPPKPVVIEIHAAWFRAALAEAGAMDAVNRAVASKGPVAVTLWEYATTIRSDDRDVIEIAQALHLNLSHLFTRAQEIRGQRAG